MSELYQPDLFTTCLNLHIQLSIFKIIYKKITGKLFAAISLSLITLMLLNRCYNA